MAGEELTVRMGLDARPFRQGLNETEQWLESANRRYDAAQKQRADADQRRVRENHRIMTESFRLVSVAGVAAIGALTAAWSEYAKRSDAAQRSIERMRGALSDLYADVGRDTFGGVGPTATEDVIRGLGGARRLASDFYATNWKFLGSLMPGGERPMTPWAAYRDVRDQDRLLREDEAIDRRIRGTGTYRRESAGFIADDRARAIEQAMLEAAEALKRIAADPDMDAGEKAGLAERIKAARDEQVRRLERGTFGAMDAQIYGAQDQVAALRSQMARASEGEREAIQSRLASAIERLAVLMATREALDNPGLSDAQVAQRIARARVEARQERDQTEAELFARRREAQAREQERARVEAERAAERARATRTSVRDQLIENDIGTLEAGGQSIEARRLSLALRYRQQQEAINANEDLTAEQRQALLDSTKSLFEAQFAALGTGERQQVLGAGSGILAGDAFSGPGPMLNVQKSMDRSLKSIDAKMTELQTIGTLR